MKIALLTTDNREPFREYAKETPWFGTAPEALLQGFAGLPEAEIHVVTCTQRPMNSPEKLAENVFFHSLLLPKLGWMRTGYSGCIRAVRRKLRELGPDIVHGQGTERDCAISTVFSGYPNILTIHGNMAEIARHLEAFPGSFLWLAGQLEKITLPRTTGVLCNSAYTETLVRQKNRRTWRVSNPVRKAFFENLPLRAVASAARPRLINVGIISPRKRQVELLELFRRLHEKGCPCQIEFVGQVISENSYSRKFLEAIDRASSSGYAAYSGLKDTDELIAVLDRADGCIHFPTEEAFGLVVAEALARNLKFFGSRVGGIVDITESIEGAELFVPEDWNGLEQALEQWIKAGSLRPENAAQMMAKLYHPLVIANRHMEIYREVIGK